MGFAVMHTSASLTINENASSDVPLDLNVSFTVYASYFPVLLHHTVPMQITTLPALLTKECMAENCDPAYKLKCGLAHAALSMTTPQHIPGAVIAGLA